MNKLNIKNVKAIPYFEDTDNYGSSIFFETYDGKPCCYIETRNNEAGFVTNEDSYEIDSVYDWKQWIDGFYCNNKQTFEIEANKMLKVIGIKLGEYHVDNEYKYYDLQSI